ncbi:MAG: hypothetical protein LBL66_09990 [Clostridiales bacterium]|jgi:hypothetical protein|nr:hypothetical protein [Clostridiales bacterium]
MEKMDERAKAEFNKINQEAFFIAIFITALWLAVKIVLRVKFVGMICEASAAGVVAVYLLVYCIYRAKNRVADERVETVLHKMAQIFFGFTLLSTFPGFFIQIGRVLRWVNSSSFGDGTRLDLFADSSVFYISSLSVVTAVYRLIRQRGEKFVTRKAADLPLADYKKKLLKRALIATAVLVVLLIGSVVVNSVLSDTFDAEDVSLWFVLFTVFGIFFQLGIPMCWFMYWYYLSMRKRLEKAVLKSRSADAPPPCAETGEHIAMPDEPPGADIE